MTEVFADFVGVTFPVEEWADVRGEVGPLLDTLGASVEVDEPGSVLWRSGDTGTVKAKRYGAVMSLSASGSMLAGMRTAKLLGSYLSAIAAKPHTVTRLDASLDVPEPTAPVIARVVAKASSDDGLRLTRKRIDPRHVTRLVTRLSNGDDTGTCYAGSKSAEVRLCVYDKRLERLERKLSDVGPLTRYELRLKSQVGVTLRDVMEPAGVFWHHVAPDVLERPAGLPEWVPNGEGFVIARAELPTPLERLRRRVQASADAHALAKLADEVGPYGFPLLLKELRSLVPAGVGAAHADREPVLPGAALSAGVPASSLAH